ncbi:unknown [Clostridium sp. CAG:967]|nr:unknown [Clostridium sp. CAG:967]
MKKLFITIMLMLLSSVSVFAITDEEIIKEQSIQARVNSVGTNILNANKIEGRIIFVYDKTAKESLLKTDKTVSKREIIMYQDYYRQIADDNELAAYLAREISNASRTYDGIGNGWLTAVQIKAAPKKFETVADKRAVDYMVKAGYNPIALITFINKAFPQHYQDVISNKNLTSKRLAVIYEYIYTKYPYYLANNEYFENPHYQNFLLNSAYNRKLLETKVKNKSRENLKYE